MNNEKKISFNCSAATNIGKRRVNQDVFFINGIVSDKTRIDDYRIHLKCKSNRPNVFAVFDGMGGMLGAGDEAAMMCAEKFSEIFSGKQFENIEEMKETAAQALDEAHKAVDKAFYGEGGTTATVLLTFGNEYILLNIGDSPAFHINRTGEVKEISHRQNMAQYHIDNGEEYSEDDECQLLYCVGVGWDMPSGVIHIYKGELSEGDKIVLCSDGITNYYQRDKLDELSNDLENLSLSEIVKKAIALDYSDNCTILCYRYD